jgi:eukaryotic-like serine/threonine-protein kinase
MSGTRWLSDEVLAHLEEVAVTSAPESGAPLTVEASAPSRNERTEFGARYELLGTLGEGGMGTVYRARDHVLGREVALKVVNLAGAEALAALEERLLAEARILARLEHPGLVPVHDLGTLPDGRVFYAMKRVRGERLDTMVRKARAERDELLRHFERVCETVAFAHAHGILHRDLKPGNIMVGSFGEVLVLDWGLAKLLTSPTAPGGALHPVGEASRPLPDDPTTAPGMLLGTPGYMAPEQCRGLPADERSDVFALGAILRFLLTGSAEPLPDAVAGLPLALLAIVGKATAAEPQGRYAGAAELAADLARYRAGAAVEALPEGWFHRVARFARRHATPIVLLLAYLLVRLAIIFFAHR